MNKPMVSHSKARYSTLKISSLLSVVGFSVLNVESSFAACAGVGCACEPSIIQFASPVLQPGPDGQYPISLEADDVEAEGEELVRLTGNAEVTQGRQTIVADGLTYHRNTDRVVATGDVEIISDGGDYLKSDSIDVIAPSQIGTLTNTEFKLAQSLTREGGIDTVEIASRGGAEIVNLEGEGIMTLENASYTTCPEGNNSVMINANWLELDRNAGIGKARNATVRFFGIPLVYLPYVSFPINGERKTGLLIPRIGSEEDSGTIVEFPWYWNIAKNQDATITPKFYEERGLQLTGEYRHQSWTSDTLIYGETLPDDEIFGDDRNLLTIKHFQDFTDSLQGAIDYNDVSDAEYFNDLSNDVSRFSATFVPRDVSLSYRNQYFNIKARGSDYQIVDPQVSEENQPFERLPQITFSTNLPDGPLGIEYGVDGSYTDFASDFRVEGTRTSLDPYIGVPFENLWGFIEPKVTLYNRSYSLNNIEPGQDENPSFSVPIFSLDAGITLEKNSTWLGKSALHTLEPRIFYAFAPEEDQADIPDFDTSEVSLNNFSGIYRDNRFFGDDRVGDTNQITFGLSSEITDAETGDRRFSASIGQLLLLDDQNVRLDDDERAVESGLGDLLAEFRIEGEYAWSTSAFIQYSHDISDIRSARFSVDYTPFDDSRKNIEVSYYLSKDSSGETSTDQIRIDAYWPITDRWSFFGNERYSFEDSDSLFTTLGFEYDGCCWKLRAVASESGRNGGLEDKERYFFVELELKSIGALSQGIF